MATESNRFGLPRGIGQHGYGAMGSTVGPTFASSNQIEITSLSTMIAANTLQVRQSWQYLEKVAPMVGTLKDTRSLRYKIHDNRTGTNQRIIMTTQDLQRLMALVPRGEKEKRLQVDLLKYKFTEVIKAYTTSQQYIADKMKQVLLANEIVDDQASDDGEDVTDNSRSDLQQKLIQIKPDLHLEHRRLLEREQEILDIETAVVDVNHIMRDLSNLVHQQGGGIDSIENAITHVAENVERGTKDLGNAATYQNKSRRKVLIILIIAVILVLLITCTIISKLKS